MANEPVIQTIRPDDTSKPDPFTIVIVSNPALEAPWNSRTFVTDPITSNQAAFGYQADVVSAISVSTTHTRASAWFTTDDDTRPGVGFTLDGVALSHRFYTIIPGTVALPVNSTSLTALHEFSHAFSSYTNGAIVDLDADSGPGLNNKRGRPAPATFVDYDGTVIASDPKRGGLGYPENWQSYHCELLDPTVPAVMDNYWQAPDGVPEHCQHDRITRQFLRDRILAKLSR